MTLRRWTASPRFGEYTLVSMGRTADRRYASPPFRGKVLRSCRAGRDRKALATGQWARRSVSRPRRPDQVKIVAEVIFNADNPRAPSGCERGQSPGWPPQPARGGVIQTAWGDKPVVVDPKLPTGSPARAGGRGPGKRIDERRRESQLKYTQRHRITGRCAGGPDPADDDAGTACVRVAPLVRYRACAVLLPCTGTVAEYRSRKPF